MIWNFGKAAAVVVAILGVAMTASWCQAGMIPTSVSVTPDGNNFRWTYAVVVTTDVKVNPGDSFTIYDFGGLVNGSVMAPAGWTTTTSLATVGRPGTNPHDNPAIPDFTFTWTGTSPIQGQQGLGNFSAISTYNTSQSSDFTSSAHRQVDGRLENNITTTDVPMSGTGPHNAPEPTTLILFGAGLPIVGLVRYLRHRNKA